MKRTEVIEVLVAQNDLLGAEERRGLLSSAADRITDRQHPLLLIALRHWYAEQSRWSQRMSKQRERNQVEGEKHRSQ